MREIMAAANTVCALTICLAVGLVALNGYLFFTTKLQNKAEEAKSTEAFLPRTTLGNANPIIKDNKKQELTTHTPLTTVEMEKSSCYENMAWWGDGNCDDRLNTANCQFDGGDCCLPEINNKFCLSCTCKFDGLLHLFEETTTFPSFLGCPKYVAEMVGDGVCDDWTNNPDCDYDGGDCCLTIRNKSRCFFCQCKS